jgi:hypothetical protein
MTVSNKERAAMVLESAHYTVKEIAFSLAMEVDFDLPGEKDKMAYRYRA